MKKRTRLDLLRNNYDKLDSLRHYFKGCDQEVVNYLNMALNNVREATISYQKLHCNQEMGWGILEDIEAGVNWASSAYDR